MSNFQDDDEMILNTYFYQPVSTYLDLAFARSFDDDGVETERRMGTTVTTTTTYSDGFREDVTVNAIGGGRFRLGDIEFISPSGQILVEIAIGDLSIETSDFDTLDITDFADRARFNFSDVDDLVPLGESLVISETRGNRTQELLSFDSDVALEFYLGRGNDRAVLDLARDGAQVTELNGIFELTTPSATGRFRDLEVFEFSDGALLLNEAGDFADYTYALYAAALTRTPDEDGFRFWNGVMNSDAFSGGTRKDKELSLATEFVEAAEFTQNFDVSTNAAYVNALYNNVLRRDADDGGFDFWLGVFDTGEQGRDDMLRFFALSEENLNRIADDIDTGYWVI